MKCLMVNLQNPGMTKYVARKDVGVFLLGRRLSNYIINLVDVKTGECLFTIDFNTLLEHDVRKIQAAVDNYFEHFERNEDEA